MKVIFLDIDGVLNTCRTHVRRKDHYIGIEQRKVLLLKQIVDATGAHIVLSSTWRSSPDSFNDARLCLWTDGLVIFDVTPDYNFRRPRGHEIADWLEQHPEVTHYVIIDDVDEFANGRLRKHFVQTDFYGLGLTQLHCEKAIKILNEVPR